MNEWETLTSYNWMYWIAGLFALLEMGKWLYLTFAEFIFGKLGFKTKGMLKKEEYEKRLKNVENAIEEIKNTSKHNVAMFIDHEGQVVAKFMDIKDEIVKELDKLHDKIDKQKAEMEKVNKANTKTDCAILRDRISGGMRYFSKNIGNDGKVHISLSDYANMEALFQEYFSHGGNGIFEKMYEEEFKHFVIDR